MLSDILADWFAALCTLRPAGKSGVIVVVAVIIRAGTESPGMKGENEMWGAWKARPAN